jgi:hypothetical protein
MPYIPQEDRIILNRKIDKLAEDIVYELVKNGEDAEISVRYKDKIIDLCETIYSLLSGKNKARKTRAEELAYEIVNLSKKYDYKGAWLGELNYSLTMLIQVVPYKMVKTGNWKEEFRYWIYAQTVGALERAASKIERKKVPKKNEWIIDGIVGVLHDVKDEYKRRVNAAYEAFQIKKSGDCYITPYHTELEEVKDDKGNILGWREVEKDFKNKNVEEVKDEKGNVVGWKRI